MTESKENEGTPAVPAPDSSEDDRRAAAAAANRKRTEKDWDEAKKRWLSMGVPKPLPAKK